MQIQLPSVKTLTAIAIAIAAVYAVVSMATASANVAGHAAATRTAQLEMAVNAE